VVSQKVEVRRDIIYTGGDSSDGSDPAGDKHKLDLYLPKDQRNFPVLVFIHGGSWRSGDRNLYTVLGNRFAESGIGVAIPSYRLMPKNPHPAQIEDAAAAVAWVYKKMAEFGGDTKRLYIAGHSAGGHLVALLALDDSYLSKYDVPISAIKGVAALSGVYDVSGLRQFQVAGARDASSMHYLGHNKSVKAPPFLITYCQWDYPSLPLQAREFEAALKKSFVQAKLVYVPGENHISEMVNIGKEDDVTARAILDLVK
jgi:acetyl esterase/lipase